MDPIQRPTTMSMSTRGAYDLDLRDVRGQIGARRAVEVAAAGGHNVLMIGSAGCGKTMLAVRLPALLPVADGDTECPFRAPHHTASALVMFGSAGEVAQGRRGVEGRNAVPRRAARILPDGARGLARAARAPRRRLGHVAGPVPACCGDGTVPVRGMRRDARDSTVHRRADGALPRPGGGHHR